MMRLNKVPTVKLAKLLDGLFKEKPINQEEINYVAFELARRIYVPNQYTTFEDMLYEFGFRFQDKEKNTMAL